MIQDSEGHKINEMASGENNTEQQKCFGTSVLNSKMPATDHALFFFFGGGGGCVGFVGSNAILLRGVSSTSLMNNNTKRIITD